MDETGLDLCSVVVFSIISVEPSNSNTSYPVKFFYILPCIYAVVCIHKVLGVAQTCVFSSGQLYSLLFCLVSYTVSVF